jgi:hypothetical protein
MDEDTKRIESIMKTVSKKNGLLFKKEVKLIPGETPDNFSKYILANQNKTLYGVLFCVSEYFHGLIFNRWKVGNISIPCKFDYYKDNYNMNMYSLYFNNSLEPDIFMKLPTNPAPTDPSLLRLKISIDNAIMEYFAKKRNMSVPEIKATMNHYPMPPDRMMNGYNLISVAGPFFFIFTPMVAFMIILIQIMGEKENRLRHVQVLTNS